MTLEEQSREYERRGLDAERHKSSGPVCQFYSIVLEELRSLDGFSAPDRMMDTGEAARILGVAPKTVRAWASESRFPGARKTSDWGEWRIPAEAVYREAGMPTSEPMRSRRLWTPDQKGGS